MKQIVRSLILWVLRSSGADTLLYAEQAHQAAVIEGLRRDLEQHAVVIGMAARQVNTTTIITHGILQKIVAFVKASKPLMNASRKLHAAAKRAKREAEENAEAEKAAATGATEGSPAALALMPPASAGDATASNDLDDADRDEAAGAAVAQTAAAIAAVSGAGV